MTFRLKKFLCLLTLIEIFLFSPCFSEIFLGHVGHLNIIALVYGHAFFESNSDVRRQIRECHLLDINLQVPFPTRKPLPYFAVFF